jgi:hypothetical protein
VPRKEEFVATFRKEGYAEAEVPVRIVTGGRGAAEFAASAIGGGFVGAMAYGASGRGYDHEPNPVVAELQPNKPAAPARRTRTPARDAGPAAAPAM